MVTISVLLVLLAFLLTIASAVGKCPLWVPVFLLAFLELLRVWPLR